MKIKDYALTFCGVPYKWGGNNPIEGLDCSGLVQCLLATASLDPPGRQTAQALFDYFRTKAPSCQAQEGALLFFGQGPELVTHTAFCLDAFHMIEAGGGGHLVLTIQDAAVQNAYVKVSPISHRKDLVGILMPPYPAGLISQTATG